MCYSALVKQNLKYLEDEFLAHVIREDYEEYEYRSKNNPKKFKNMQEHARIYPNYYASIITSDRGKRILRPMRYRLHPSWSQEEIPAKYNLFNARMDSLTERKSWKNLIGSSHGLLVFEKFYEWVEDDKTGKKKIISFSPKDREVMWSPVLWDYWKGNGPHTDIYSFAIITTDPPPEVSMMGHDRCPVFLKKNLIDEWLNPKGKSIDQLMNILRVQEDTYFEWANAA